MSINPDEIFDRAFCSRLNQETLNLLCKFSGFHTYENDQIIQIEGELCQWAAVVVTGSVQIYKLAVAGREQILTTLLPGTHFNTVPAVDANCKLRASARAVGNTKLLLIPIENYRILLQTRADLSFYVLSDFAHRLDHLTELVDWLSLHSIRGRLASFLLEQADLGKEPGLWTHDEIASHLGTVRDVIGRTLRSFLDSGLIRREGSKLILLDRQKLEDEAQF